jgi:hypothetical protein
MFANISGHPTTKWSRAQITDAGNLSGGAGIVDVPFPRIDPYATEEEVDRIALKLCDHLPGDMNSAMVMGEYSLTIRIVEILKDRGIDVVVASMDAGFTLDDNGQPIRPFIKFRHV